MERRAFYDVIGEFNESEAMKGGVIYVPLSLVNMRDKRPYQFVVEENIRTCRHFILVCGGEWGPPERNFNPDYRCALQAGADPSLPMRDVAYLSFKNPEPPAQSGGSLPASNAVFSTTAEFKERLRGLLSTWLAQYLDEGGRARSAAPS
jgi:hypothetical protein